MIAGPRHFAALAGRLRWDPAAIDLAPDTRAWPSLAPRRRARLTALLAGFLVAESSVAEELAPFTRAAGDATAAAFAAQRADEERHADLFDRIAAEVLDLPGQDPEGRRDAARAVAPRALVDLFDRRLPATAAALAEGRAELAEAVGLYHLLLEGAVLGAGQRALLDDLADGALPGVRTGVALVERDERWHVGFGLRCLLDLRVGPEPAAELLAEGLAAVAAWGDAVPAPVRERAAARHRRRLAALAQAATGSVA
jgi:ribonucleoside-diphosphate reductase beta chain